jgi:hypothetical protein
MLWVTTYQHFVRTCCCRLCGKNDKHSHFNRNMYKHLLVQCLHCIIWLPVFPLHLIYAPLTLFWLSLTKSIIVFHCSGHSKDPQVQVKVTLRLTVSRPVSLGVRRPSGTRDQFFFLLEIFFRHMRFSNFVAPSLTRGRVCNLLVQLLLGLARAVTLGTKSRRTNDHILLSHLRLPQPEGPDPRIYIPQEQGGPVIPPGTGFPFVTSYDSQGSGGGILTRLHMGPKILRRHAIFYSTQASFTEEQWSPHTPNYQAGRPLLISLPHLHIQYIHS